MGSHILFEAMDRLKTTLTDCTHFREWTGEPSSEAAAERIHFGSLPGPQDKNRYTPDELASYRPFVIISTNESAGITLRRAATNTWWPSGTLLAHFEMETPLADAHDVAKLDADVLTHIGKLLAANEDDAAGSVGLANLFHNPAGDYLAGDMVVFHGLFRSNRDDHPGQGDFLYWLLEISWGVAG